MVNLQILQILKIFKFLSIEIEIKVCIILKNDFWTILRHENFMYMIAYVHLIKNCDAIKKK